MRVHSDLVAVGSWHVVRDQVLSHAASVCWLLGNSSDPIGHRFASNHLDYLCGY